MHETRHCVCCYNSSKVFEQGEQESLDCPETNIEVPKWNSETHITFDGDKPKTGNKDDRKSTSGYLFRIAGGPVSWRSKNQDTVALSTAEAEYLALSSAAQAMMWLRRLKSDLGNMQKDLSSSMRTINLPS